MPQEHHQHLPRYEMTGKDQVSSQDTAVLLVNRKRIAAPNVEIVDLNSRTDSGSKVLVAPMV